MPRYHLAKEPHLASVQIDNVSELSISEIPFMRAFPAKDIGRNTRVLSKVSKRRSLTACLAAGPCDVL